MILNKLNFLGVKSGVEYFQDENGIIFCEPLDQANKLGGTKENERNISQNLTRIERVKQIKEGANVLDFGCGNGLLVNDFKQSGINASGYDKFSTLYKKRPKKESFDIVLMIEVIEHLTSPFKELDLIYKSLVKGGSVIVETSFTDWLTLEDTYIEPSIGHSTIFSHKGLTKLMQSKGFIEGEHIDRNTRVYTK